MDLFRITKGQIIWRYEADIQWVTLQRRLYYRCSRSEYGDIGIGGCRLQVSAQTQRGASAACKSGAEWSHPQSVDTDVQHAEGVCESNKCEVSNWLASVGQAIRTCLALSYTSSSLFFVAVRNPPCSSTASFILLYLLDTWFFKRENLTEEEGKEEASFWLLLEGTYGVHPRVKRRHKGD